MHHVHDFCMPAPPVCRLCSLPHSTTHTHTYLHTHNHTHQKINKQNKHAPRPHPTLSGGRVPVSVLERYLSLESNPLVRAVWNIQGFRERLLADPSFPVKVGWKYGHQALFSCACALLVGAFVAMCSSLIATQQRPLYYYCMMKDQREKWAGCQSTYVHTHTSLRMFLPLLSASPSLIPVYQVGIECGIGVFTKVTAERTKRGDNFWAEIDFVGANVVMAVIADFMLTWLPAPTLSFSPSAPSGGALLSLFAHCPDNAFQRVQVWAKPRCVAVCLCTSPKAHSKNAHAPFLPMLSTCRSPSCAAS